MNNKADFHDVCKEYGGGFIIAGQNYGQGSSREHAALAPMYLGIKAVVAKSFARIHRANLINFGILPLTFANESDYDTIDEMDELHLNDLHSIEVGKPLTLVNVTKGKEYIVNHNLSDLDIELIKAGGTLNHIKNNQ